MELTHQYIFNQPNARVSRMLTLLKLDAIRSSAKSKADTITEHGELDPGAQLYAKWFDELAEQANRAINELNEASEEIQYVQ